MVKKRIIVHLFIFVVPILSILLIACKKDDVVDGKEIIPIKEVDSNGHDFVDMGLSVYWATCNVGALVPSEIGDKFAFCETETKTEFVRSNYFGGNGDAGRNWGGAWRSPTKTEFVELLEACEWYRDYINGRLVMRAFAPNGNSVVFPYVSYYSQGSGVVGTYWSSTAYSSTKAWGLVFDNNEIFTGYNDKYLGCLVRPVMTNPNYTGAVSSVDNNSGENNSFGEAPNVTSFDYTATSNSLTVKFYTDERPTSASVYYGENSATKSAGTPTIASKQVSVTVRGLKSGTKYYFKCIVRNEYGSSTSDGWPAMTFY